MPDATPNSSREPWLRLIESQSDIGGRFVDLTRLDLVGGKGNFSLVFRAKDALSKRQRQVILKFFNPMAGGDLYRRECFEREGNILKDLIGQRNILPMVQELTTINVPLQDGIQFPLSFYASHMAKHSLADYLYSPFSNHRKSIRYFREVCKAVQRIHRKQICHRDLKPDQFLIFPSGYVCLADFGTSRYFGGIAAPIRTNYQAPSGDTRYTAPELLAGLHFSDQHNYAADIYSLGCILFELYSQNIFYSNVFTGLDIHKFIISFQPVPVASRIGVFEGLIGSISSTRPLPSVRSFDPTIPVAAGVEIDKLYMSMACLDSRRRETNFDNIFLRINIVEKILDNLKKVEAWQRLKIQRRGD